MLLLVSMYVCLAVCTMKLNKYFDVLQIGVWLTMEMYGIMLWFLVVFGTFLQFVGQE